MSKLIDFETEREKVKKEAAARLKALADAQRAEEDRLNGWRIKALAEFDEQRVQRGEQPVTPDIDKIATRMMRKDAEKRSERAKKAAEKRKAKADAEQAGNGTPQQQ